MSGQRSRFVLWTALSLGALSAFVLPAAATTFGVINTNDSGAGSLRAAIDAANADLSATSGSPHSIVFSGVSGSIRLQSMLPIITNHMTIDGGTLGTVVVHGTGLYRGFFIDLGTVTLKNLVIYDVRAKGGDAGGGAAGGGAGLGGAIFVNQASASVTVDTVAISTANVTGGRANSTFAAFGGGGGGMGFAGGFTSLPPPPTGRTIAGGGGGGGLFGPGGNSNTAAGLGGAGGAGGGGGGGGVPTGGTAGGAVTDHAAAGSGVDRGAGIAINGEAPVVGGAGGFGGGGGGGVLDQSTGYIGSGGAGGFGGGGGGSAGYIGNGNNLNPPTRGGAGGFGGGGGGGTVAGVAGFGGGNGGTRLSGGGGAAFGPAAFVNLGTLTVVNSTAFNLTATAGLADSNSDGATDGTADATPIFNRAGTVTGSFADGTPQSGYWWYSVETGRGFPIEIKNNRVFLTFYHYADDGTARWWVSTGSQFTGLTLNAGRYSSPVWMHTGGQELNGAYRPFSTQAQTSTVVIEFYAPTLAAMTWADGTVPLTRFDIVTGGVTAGPAAGSPEKGWYWNFDERGRGWFVEIQGSTMFLSGFMYDARGAPTWYISQGAMTTASVYTGTLLLFANGKTIGGPNRAPDPGVSQGTVTMVFPTSTTAVLTLPGGGIVNLTRFQF